jgi:hypothetical protein
VVKVTIEVPESLLGDVYYAVGRVLARNAQEIENNSGARRHDGHDDSGPDEGEAGSAGADRDQD